MTQVIGFQKALEALRQIPKMVLVTLQIAHIVWSVGKISHMILEQLAVDYWNRKSSELFEKGLSQ
jgi:hypothetical protein